MTFDVAQIELRGARVEGCEQMLEAELSSGVLKSLGGHPLEIAA